MYLKKKTITMRYIITSFQTNTYSPTAETQINLPHNNSTTSDNMQYESQIQNFSTPSTHTSNLNLYTILFYIIDLTKYNI